MRKKQRAGKGARGTLGGEVGRMASLGALSLLLTTGCTSGGGGDDGGDGSIPVPSVVTFTTGTGGVPLELDFAGGSAEVQGQLSGSYNVNNDEWAADAGTVLDIDSGALFGVLEVVVIDRLQGTAWDVPRSGTLQIHQVSTGDRITVGVVADGVEILYDDLGDGQNVLGPFAHTWEELYELFGTSPAEYEAIGSFVWSAVELTRERFLVVFQVFVSVFELAEFLESIGPEMRVEVPDGCQTLPGSANVGDGIFIWHDDNASGLIDTGDSFSVLVEDCWVDSPGPLDSLFDGMIELTGFSYSPAPFSTGAAVEYQDFRSERTEEAGGVYAIVPDSAILTRGNSSVAFD